MLAPFGMRNLRALERADFKLPAIAGVFLALHFATWIASIGLTTVAASVLLVSTTPVFVALVAWIFLRERLPAAAWSGVVIAFVGTALIAGADLSGSNLNGNILALIGGITAAGYVLVGQAARRRMGLIEYAVTTYAAAAVLLVIACLLAGVELVGFDTQTWLAVAGMVIGPQLLGHTVINFVLKDIDATAVAVVINGGEPLLATWLAFVLFSELPPALIYPGGVATLIGIYLVTTNRREPVPVGMPGEPFVQTERQ